MEFVFILAIILFQMFFIDFLEVMEIVWALGIHALMNDEVLTVFLMDQGMAAVRAAQGVLF